MIRGLVTASVRSRGVIAALTVLVLGLAGFQLTRMPVDTLPEFSATTVEVRTEALGLSAYEVEQLITAPMEQNLLNGVAYLDHVSSRSLPGLSVVEMTFEDGTDPLDARQVVQERLTEAHKALPNVSDAPQMLQPLSTSSRVMMVGLRSDEVQMIDLSVLARWTIRPALLGVPGVANVAIWGQRDRQLQVLVDPQRLDAADVTVDQVIASTGNALWASPLTFLEAAAPGRGGFIETPTQRIGIQHVNPIITAQDLSQITIESRPGQPAPAEPLLLGDIAEVIEHHQPLIGDGLVDDGTGLVLVIEKFPGANTLDVTGGIEKELGKLAPGLTGVEVQTSLYRPAAYISAAHRNLTGLLFGGIALGLVALAALRRSWQTPLVAMISIATSLALTVIALHWLGHGINLMIIAGVVLAAPFSIADVVGARAATRHGSPATGGSARSTVIEHIQNATADFCGPLGYATAAALLMVVPLFVLTGEADAFFPVIATAFGAMLVSSTIVGLTVVPAMSALLVRKTTTSDRSEPLLVSRYRRVLGASLGRPWRVIGGVVAAGAISIVGLALTHSNDSLVPALADSNLLVRWDGPAGTSLAEMNRIASRAGAELRAIDGVGSVGAHTGRAILADDTGGANTGEFWIRLDSDADYANTVSRVRSVLNGYPGIAKGLTDYSSDRIADVTGGDGSDLTIRVSGNDHEVMQAKAAEVVGKVGAIDGVGSAVAEIIEVEPTIEVVVDLAAAERAQIKPGDVRRAAATYIQGLEVGSVFIEQKVFQVVVQGVPEIRENLTDMKNLLIDTQGSGLVPLAQLADITIAPNPTAIRHEAVVRSLDIQVRFDGDSGDAVHDIEAALASIDFPLEHRATILGSRDAQRDARNRFSFVVIGAALAAFLILQAAVKSWRLAVAMSLAIPSAVSGGVIAALLAGGTLSIGSIVGLMGVSALTTRFVVLLVRSYQHPDPDHPVEAHPPATLETVMAGAAQRFAPVLVTTVVSVVMLLPLLFAGSRAGTEVVHPMVVVLTGGLIAAGLFTTIAAPVLYFRFAPWRELYPMPDAHREPPEPAEDRSKPKRQRTQTVESATEVANA